MADVVRKAPRHKSEPRVPPVGETDGGMTIRSEPYWRTEAYIGSHRRAYWDVEYATCGHTEPTHYNSLRDTYQKLSKGDEAFGLCKTCRTRRQQVVKWQTYAPRRSHEAAVPMRIREKERTLAQQWALTAFGRAGASSLHEYLAEHAEALSPDNARFGRNSAGYLPQDDEPRRKAMQTT
jgi:hypothetical protein